MMAAVRSWLVVVLLLPSVESSSSPVVTLAGGGRLYGVESNGVNEYLGVRFAEPARRFEAPVMRDGTQSQNATAPGPTCVQSSGGDEDCLFMNVFQPKAASSSSSSSSLSGRSSASRVDGLLEGSRPVFFYLHGGGFVSGSATMNAWNLTKLAQVVVVAPQYRLGVFGYFRGNYGLADQVVALEWTRLNARSFGGDAAKVLVMGCSAGGAIVANLLVSSSSSLAAASPPFAAAAIESPGTHQGWKADELRSDDDFMSLSLRNANADALEAEISSNLETADAATVFQKASSRRFAPAIVDEEGEETYPLAQLRRKGSLAVPVIVGGQSCESCADAASYLGPPSEDEDVSYDDLRLAVKAAGFGEVIGVDTVLGWYEDRRRAEGNWRTFARILSDSDHACSAALHARALAEAKKTLWRYFFAYDADVPYPGATHCGIESYVWHLGGKPDVLATALSTWLKNLVDFGDVDDPTLPQWQPFTSQGDAVMYLGLEDDPTPRMNVSTDTTRPECDHWRPYLGWD